MSPENIGVIMMGLIHLWVGTGLLWLPVWLTRKLIFS